MDALAKFAGVDLPDVLCRELEGIVILLVNLSQQTTVLGVTSAIMLHTRSYFSSSVTKIVSDFISELFKSDNLETQSGVEILTPHWLECLRNVKLNWQLCKSNKAFHQLSKLLGLLVTLGLCKVTDLEFNIGRFNIFTPSLNEKHSSAHDLADAMFETVTYFAEAMYMCFKTGSIKPLLINDHSALELDEEYARIMSWWDLVKCGNLKRMMKVSDQEFERRLNELTSKLRNLLPSLKGLDKKLVSDKFMRCLAMQNDFITMKISSGVRRSPFAFQLFGESSQGKTTCGDQLVDALLISAGLPTEKQFRAAFNAGDKYMSNWTSDKLVLIFDDCSNEKSTFVERPPTRAILDVCNNQMYYANKAELAAKGKCFVEPWIVVATTNKKDLDAPLYSNCPYSIQRRLISITVKVKPHFQKTLGDNVNCGIDATKVREYYTNDEGVYEPPAFDDIWLLTVEEAVKPEKLTSVAKYEVVDNMFEVSMKELINWMIDRFQEHNVNQEALLEGLKRRETKMSVCPRKDCRYLHGACPEHYDENYAHRCGYKRAMDMKDCTETYEYKESAPVTRQFGKETVKSLYKLKDKAYDHFVPNMKIFGDKVDKVASEVLYKQGTTFLKKWDWVKLVPASFFEMPYARDCMRFFYKERIEADASTAMWNITVAAILALLFILYFGYSVSLHYAFPLIYIDFALAYHAYSKVRNDTEDRLFEVLKERNLIIHPIVKRYRDDSAKYICSACFGIAALYGIARAYRAWKNYESQGSLEPKTHEDIRVRDMEKNVWTDVVKRDLPISRVSKCVVSDVLEKQVSKNLVYGSIHLEDGTTGMVNGLFLDSNVLLLPDHYFEEFGDTLSCTFRKENPDQCGGKFAAIISKSASIKVPDKDMRLCYCTTGGSFLNLTKHFPIGKMPSAPFRLLYRVKSGGITVAKGYTEPKTVTTIETFEGGEYRNLNMNTFKGMCGAVLVGETKGSVVLGIHLGGVSGTPRGCYGSLLQNEITTAVTALKKIEGVIKSGSSGKFEPQVLGKEILINDPLHIKSPLRYMPHNSQVEYYGSCVGKSTQKSDVRVTPISEHIIDVCDIPNIYRGPKMSPDWFGWQNCLEGLSVPAIPYPHELLELAVKDFKEPLIEIYQSELWNDTRPLTDGENMCGIPGKKFVDGIKLNTAIGFPLTGKKIKYITECAEGEENTLNRAFTKDVMDEITRCEDCYKAGERAYPIAKACKKDEILAKDKCRIFYGNAIALTYLVRKYYLPVLRVIQMNPLVSECAVGINCHGPEWEEFYQHATKHGMDRLFGGDYGKYDQKIPSQLIFAALRIMIDFARECDYTEEDLSVMEAMTGDIVFAYIAFNGDLIGLTEGTHISGNSLTVAINGICGSLNLRCYYYSQYETTSFGERRKFRDYVSAMTYGDDNIGSVHKDEHKFTIKGISEFLANYGQIYTMPDKESELLDFLPAEQFEFLKRISVYHPELGHHVGALLDKSIFKSLHCFMRPKGCVNTEEEACAINIDGAVREWFNHGKEVYDLRLAQMKEVAARAGIDHITAELDMTYKMRVDNWKNRYDHEYQKYAMTIGDVFDGIE